MSDHDDDPLLGEYLDAWLQERGSQFSVRMARSSRSTARRPRPWRGPTTLKSYAPIIRNYLKPQLGSERLSELHRRNIETAYGRLLDAGGR